MSKHCGLVLCLLAMTTGLQAEDIRPGLWEVSNKAVVDGQSMPDMGDMLAQVPPEMRAQVEQMMAQQGAGLGSKGIRICLTAEQIDKQEYGGDPEGDCQVTDIETEGNVTRMKMRCKDPKGEGTTTVTRLGPEAWRSETTMTVEQDGGKHTMHNKADARWIQADCGTIKPVSH